MLLPKNILSVLSPSGSTWIDDKLDVKYQSLIRYYHMHVIATLVSYGRRGLQAILGVEQLLRPDGRGFVCVSTLSGQVKRLNKIA